MTKARLLPLTLPSTDPATLMAALPPGPGRFLLESGPAGPAAVRRYSFAGAEPFATLVTRGHTAYLYEAGRTRVLEGDPLVVLQALLNRWRVDPPDGWNAFSGGAVGCFAYDLGRQIERLPALSRDEQELPDLWIGFYDVVLCINHTSGDVVLCVAPPAGRESDALAKARRWAQALKVVGPLPPPDAGFQAGPVRSDFTSSNYRTAVQRAQGYIAAGDIFQVNLSQRFTCPIRGTGWELFRRLRDVNPAPFAAFIDAGAWQVVSGSPERFLTVQDGRIETRPIKGTRPRHPDAHEDRAAATELWASEKDRAELMMIVDLLRNDLGRLCQYGTVHVPDVRRLEETPNVWHTVATIEGQLRAGVTPAQILNATFPGGSITGTPKVRAMEIIEELEPVRRGLYTGAIGYIGCDGTIDLNIAIRTAVVKDGVVTFSAGGGIVADSDPADEYVETIAKARGIARALGVSLDDLP